MAFTGARLGRSLGGVAAAAVGLQVAHQWVPQQQFLPRPQPPVFCEEAIKRRVSSDSYASKQVTTTESRMLLFKKYTARYGLNKNVQLTYRDVRELLIQIGIESDYVCGRIFFVIDKDGSGTVDFKEMSSFCKALAKGSTQEKAKFMFKACDLDGDNQIQKDEMRAFVKEMVILCEKTNPEYSLVKTEKEAELYADLHGDVLAQVIANRVVADMFAAADTDRSGTIDLKEFMFWVTRGGKNYIEFCELFPVLEILSRDA